MIKEQFIATQSICRHYDIEISFVNALGEMGLVEIAIVEECPCIHQDSIGDLEKIIRLYNELDVNLEGIDVILNLLEKEKALQEELNALKNRLRLYESL